MFLSIVRVLIITIGCVVCGIHSMHQLQAMQYRVNGLKKQMTKSGFLKVKMEMILAAVLVITDWYLPVLMSMMIKNEDTRTAVCRWIVLLLCGLGVWIVYNTKNNIRIRKKFTISERIGRLAGCDFVLSLAGILLLLLCSCSPYLILIFAEPLVLVSSMIMEPIEEKINASYYDSARKKFKSLSTLVSIGITGSYGKTEVKQILKQVLSERFRVLATPPNYSTRMGIARVIHEQLTQDHQILIVEMGANEKNAIKDMAWMVRPKYGVITNIGPRRLDVFGSVEAVAAAKRSLIQALPKDGAVFFGADNGYGDRLYARTAQPEKYRAGVGTKGDYDIYATGVSFGPEGTEFSLMERADGEAVQIHTRLLGNFCVRNIALAACVARKLGMSMEEIRTGIEKVKPLRHHLQLLPGQPYRIDDSLNASLEGAFEALGVLDSFPGKRILVTSGFDIPGEDDMESKMYEYGTRISEHADYVILIGPEACGMISDGLIKAGYPQANCRMVREEEDALALLNEIADEDSSILYEGIFLQAGEE